MPKTLQEILNTPDVGNEHRSWIIEATDEQLDEYILRTSNSNSAGLHRMALAARDKRHFIHLSKAAEPHWTILPAYRLLQITVCLTILAIIITVLAWWFPGSHGKRFQFLNPLL